MDFPELSLQVVQTSNSYSRIREYHDMNYYEILEAMDQLLKFIAAEDEINFKMKG